MPLLPLACRRQCMSLAPGPLALWRLGSLPLFVLVPAPAGAWAEGAAVLRPLDVSGMRHLVAAPLLAPSMLLRAAILGLARACSGKRFHQEMERVSLLKITGAAPGL
jgi:hypothetical protein